jgi:hypothetical protein
LVDVGQLLFANRGSRRWNAPLLRLDSAHEIAQVAHVGADVVGHPAIAAQEAFRSGQGSAAVDHRFRRIIHGAGRILAGKKSAQAPLAKHLRLCAMRGGDHGDEEYEPEGKPHHADLLSEGATT